MSKTAGQLLAAGKLNHPMRQRVRFWSSELTWRFAALGSSPARARDDELQGGRR